MIRGSWDLKRTTLLRLAKYALAALTAALWLQEIAGAVTSLRGVNPRLDVLLDLLTGIATVAVIAMICTGVIVRAYGQQAKALASVIDATDARADRSSRRALRAVGSGKP